MARGINKVILVGNAGNDPAIRYTTGGEAIGNLSVATSETWKDKQTGEKKEATEWHRCIWFGRGAELLGEYVKKGQQLYIEGKLKTRKWTDSNGVERYTTEIRVSDWQMLGVRGDGGQGGGQRPQGGGDRQGGGQQHPQGGHRQGRQDPPQQGGGNFDDFDEDILF